MPDIGINRTSGQAVRCATEGLMKPDPDQGIDILANTRVAALAPPTVDLSETCKTDESMGMSMGDVPLRGYDLVPIP